MIHTSTEDEKLYQGQRRKNPSQVKHRKDLQMTKKFYTFDETLDGRGGAICPHTIVMKFGDSVGYDTCRTSERTKPVRLKGPYMEEESVRSVTRRLIRLE